MAGAAKHGEIARQLTTETLVGAVVHMKVDAAVAECASEVRALNRRIPSLQLVVGSQS